MAVWVQVTLHRSADPASWPRVHGSPSSVQLVGHAEGGSQVSPAWITASPQLAAQSPSFSALQPAGQHWSPAAQAVMGTWAQARVQLSTLPRATSSVQASPSAHVAGHHPGLPAVRRRSQVSPGSTTPLPQRGRQSASVSASQPSGQQPSLAAPLHAAMVWRTQVCPHDDPSPALKVAQVSGAGHGAGQASEVMPGSQVSHGGSTTPLPQDGAQSPSSAAFAPAGQQPSPVRYDAVGTNRHRAEQVPASTRRSVVQATPSVQVRGHAPVPSAIPVSQASFGSSWPFPQVAEQSGSVAWVQPMGQQPSGSSTQLAKAIGTQVDEQVVREPRSS